MQILFIARATLYSVYGGDTLQIISTAKYLRKLGVAVDIKLANEKIDYSRYELLHFFNAIRPADALGHIKKSGLPYVLSTIFVDYNEYQAKHANGIVSLLNKFLSTDQLEYIKAMARWVKNGESLNSLQYIAMGHRRSVQYLGKNAAILLPNSNSEYTRFSLSYNLEAKYKVIYNGVDPEVFGQNDDMPIATSKLENNVICVSRIEGKKNHMNLIKALNNTQFQLKIIGKPAPNHIKYYEDCRKLAAKNITFHDFVPQEQLRDYYLNAKVHILPSWNETCGLSSLEAAYFDCNLVITDKGDTFDYFGTNAWYCDPGSPESIYNAVVMASQAQSSDILRKKILNVYNWKHAAHQTLQVYENVLNKKLYKREDDNRI